MMWGQSVSLMWGLHSDVAVSMMYWLYSDVGVFQYDVGSTK